MSFETVPTVVIATKNGPVVINEEDFDPSVHNIHGKPEPVDPVSSEPAAFNRDEAKAYLTAMGVQFAPAIRNETLMKLVEETKLKVE